jgi:hypothetical protein
VAETGIPVKYAGRVRRALIPSPIRPLEREDIPAVARLYQLVMRGGAGEPPGFLAPFFERTLLDQPWADPTIPSLVYVEDGEIVAFIGSNVRRMRFDRHPVTMACSAHQIAHPRARNRGVGALLMRQYMNGPQDLTITDGATEPVRRMWEQLGGRTVHVACFSFIQVFRPWQLAIGRAVERFGFHRLEGPVTDVGALLDRATAVVAREALNPTVPEGFTTPLRPSNLLELLPEMTRTLRLRPDYDLTYLEWLFGELDREQETLWPGGVRRGRLWSEVVRREGRTLGWYVCQLRRRGFCRVLQVAASDQDVDAVLRHLAHGAVAHGAAGVYGRIEPRLVGPLSTSRSIVRFSAGRMLVSGDPRIVDAILTGESLLTRLDGEWW